MAEIKILLVEDDLNLGTVLKEFLEIKKFSVIHTTDGEEAAKILEKNNFDICIFDVMLPKKDGFTLAREVRKKDERIPIIFLTAKSMLEDKIEGLQIGGDDYITKPFSSEELLLRINNILRRVSRPDDMAGIEKIIEIGKYKFDYNRRVLVLNKIEQKLTTREADLLKLLSDNKNKIVTRSDTLKRIWNEDNYFTARSMDVYIVKLRRYLRQDKSVELANVHGTGFKLID